MQRILSLQTMAVAVSDKIIEAEIVGGSWSTLSENGCEKDTVYSTLSVNCTLEV